MSSDPQVDPDWTNESVQQFAMGSDPVAAIALHVESLLLEAADRGLLASPTNPFDLAAHMGIGLRPRFDVNDARLVTADAPHASGAQPPPAQEMEQLELSPGIDGQPEANGPAQERMDNGDHSPLRQFVGGEHDLIIEYNPTRPRGRLRYSVAHELAHAFFKDAGQATRHRTPTGAVANEHDDSWQLELLCNIAAAELLMPFDAIEGLVNSATDIDFLMAQREQLDVSTEALLRRLVHASDQPMELASFSRVRDLLAAPLKCEYVLHSRTRTALLSRGKTFESESVFAAPVAVGQTVRGIETLEGEQVSVQAVGVPPYPGARLPRVLAIVEPVQRGPSATAGLRFVTADISEAFSSIATSDQEKEKRRRIVAHVVSDSGRGWGRRGVAGALHRHVPDAANAFRAWSISDVEHLKLGNIHIVEVPAFPGGPMVGVASLVAQIGYGPSAAPRLSYVALARALEGLADVADRLDAEVHMPRIGAGQAGGRWDLIEATLDRTLVERGVPTVIYTKPSRASGTYR